jgi:hypothetical protein
VRRAIPSLHLAQNRGDVGARIGGRIQVHVERDEGAADRVEPVEECHQLAQRAGHIREPGHQQRRCLTGVDAFQGVCKAVSLGIAVAHHGKHLHGVSAWNQRIVLR